MIMQVKEYIEDGWFIEIDQDHIALYEIPLGGGESHLIGEFKTLPEAVDAALKLC
jgi:hypothetical protein